MRQEGDALRLMVALAGAILVTYAGFGAVFHAKPGWQRIAFALVLGLVLLGFAIASSRASPAGSALASAIVVI